MALNKGGRLNAKVVGASKTDFTIKVERAGGHEDSEREITLPMACWNGNGAQVGSAKLGYDREELRGPKLNDSVIFDSQADGIKGSAPAAKDNRARDDRRESEAEVDDSKFHG
jgi:hypothetical protein